MKLATILAREDPRHTVAQLESFIHAASRHRLTLQSLLCGERTNGHVPAQLSVSGMTGTSTVTVYGESRTLSATDGVFSDSFAPNDVHIYQFGGSTATGSVMFGTFRGTAK